MDSTADVPLPLGTWTVRGIGYQFVTAVRQFCNSLHLTDLACNISHGLYRKHHNLQCRCCLALAWHSVIARAAIGTDFTENIIPLQFTRPCLVTAGFERICHIVRYNLQAYFQFNLCYGVFWRMLSASSSFPTARLTGDYSQTPPAVRLCFLIRCKSIHVSHHLISESLLFIGPQMRIPA
jgi:hypothetical protein